MDKNDFIEGIHLIQDNYNTKFSSDKLKMWWNELKGMSKNEYIDSVKEQIATNKYTPKVAEIKGRKSISQLRDMNLNSSFCYKNLRELCEEQHEKNFDISTGEELEPFKS